MAQNVAMLYVGSSLHKLLPLDQPHPTIQTPRMDLVRIYDQEIPFDPQEVIKIDTWNRVGRSDDPRNYITVEYWVHVFGTDPVDYDPSTFLVPVVWWKYVLA